LNILLLQDQIEVREKLVFWLENTYGAFIREAASIEQAVELLKENDPPFDLVIYDYQKSPVKEFRAFRARIKELPCILALPGATAEMPAAITGNRTYVVNRNLFVEELQKTVGEMETSGTLKREQKETEFVRIRTKLLLSVCPLVSDIYIRLSETKFLKLFHEGAEFGVPELEKYTVRKGIEYLYVRNEEAGEFTQKYADELRFMLSARNSPLADSIRSSEAAFEVVQELGARIGFTPAVQKVIKTQVAITMRTMGSSPNLKDLLAKITRSQAEYSGAHSTLTAYLACAIASQAGWGSESTFHKLNLAAFLHDVTLSNSKLAACETIRDVEERAFTEQELKAFKEHPVQAAEVVKTFNEVPPDVDVIIAQHHERPGGNGFPRKLARTHIAPLSCVFIVAHDLARYLLSADPNLAQGAALRLFIEQARARYDSGQFKKALAAIENVTLSPP
jgi:HD-GYP domain-containing protein (c-di-GMP phosphodiesterase class II)